MMPAGIHIEPHQFGRRVAGIGSAVDTEPPEASISGLYFIAPGDEDPAKAG
jgi:hypothetical protein